MTQEFAGLGGNVGFFKNELDLQVLIGEDFTEDLTAPTSPNTHPSDQGNLPLGEDIILQASLQVETLNVTLE